jgi:hypothetical protein
MENVIAPLFLRTDNHAGFPILNLKRSTRREVKRGLVEIYWRQVLRTAWKNTDLSGTANPSEEQFLKRKWDLSTILSDRNLVCDEGIHGLVVKSSNVLLMQRKDSKPVSRAPPFRVGVGLMVANDGAVYSLDVVPRINISTL